MALPSVAARQPGGRLILPTRNQHIRRRGVLYRYHRRQRELLGDDITQLPNGSRQEIIDKTAEPHTMETYRRFRARGIFVDGLPAEVAEEWADFATGNVLDQINPLLESDSLKP
jgi:hypothetical protein